MLLPDSRISVPPFSSSTPPATLPDTAITPPEERSAPLLRLRATFEGTVIEPPPRSMTVPLVKLMVIVSLVDEASAMAAASSVKFVTVTVVAGVPANDSPISSAAISSAAAARGKFL
ncbi:hypothetical protein SDC9_86298 [bioreactor metagenome]|uniref:Uncharacterized protein n=1 Tax=bioreactor metagenome TaxID=1076179 RepID=A0A644ZPV7_9ZZZZ